MDYINLYGCRGAFDSGFILTDSFPVYVCLQNLYHLTLEKLAAAASKNSKIGTTRQTLRLLEFSSEKDKFLSVTSSMACA